MIKNTNTTAPEFTLDLHRLSGGFDPSAYTVIDTFDYNVGSWENAHGEIEQDAEPMSIENDEKLHNQGTSLNHCTHCGCRLVRGYVAEHVPTGQLIIIGHKCADRLEFKDAAELARAIRSRKAHGVGLTIALRRHPELADTVTGLENLRDDTGADSWCQSVASEMLEKLAAYYSWSEKQVAFANRLPAMSDQKVKKAIEEAMNSVPWTEDGRLSVEGVVVSTKEVDGAYGLQVKMLVKLDDGRKCWGSMPGNLNLERNDRVSFTATFSVSRDDPGFAFYKRPSKGVFVEPVE